MDLPVPPALHGAGRPLALVVESETASRIKTADRLAETGFEVLEAWSAQSALLQIERHAGLRLVVVDADLPGSEARFALTCEIARHRPDLALIALSAGPSPDPGTLPEGVRFAAKPLTPALAREALEPFCA
ncbi:response regulator [Methylobacterium sp. J-043]|uniref:response regulator n=1 Tax=Methylorubrum TaxID=2282523 RepID=UPI00209D2AF1|nr:MULTISPECIES: response regulator [Methylorubrum]MCJ2029413.1 response regulator [Methylobacterium sp. J-043]MCP1549734.1 CheY-like chemotaxis protein [Methylorubrum zatmanii]MCP1553652.1 CheY-like chemotaxis protein [Methylorubrum extorquens]MCP1580036.1 CheY-like chemotaxis protein [Methylorubrum extorquens]